MEPTHNPTPDMGANQGKNSENTAMAVIAYILFFIPLLTDAKNDPFVKFHIKQGAVIFIIGLATWVITMVLPILIMISWLVQLFLLVMVVLGIINVVNNKKELLPIIGQYGEKLNF